MEDYLIDCSVKTFKKYGLTLRNVEYKRLLKKMQERVKVLS